MFVSMIESVINAVSLRYAAGPLSGDAQNQLHSVVDDKSRRPPKGGVYWAKVCIPYPVLSKSHILVAPFGFKEF